jgi:signal peptidase complex subunit 2
MTRSKKTQNNDRPIRTPSPNPSGAVSSSPSSPERPAGPLSIVIAPQDRDVIKVNHANLTELKHACDDAVKRVRSFCRVPRLSA